MQKILTVLILMSILPVAIAEDRRPYSIAGCGLGSLVFGKKNQVLAATTNATWSQSFGITVGTSNCAERTYRAERDVPPFVEANQIALSNDIARGGGETLEALGELVGCADTKLLAESLKPFAVLNPAIVLKRLVSSRELSRTCRYL